jgi:hypothetical protein
MLQTRVGIGLDLGSRALTHNHWCGNGRLNSTGMRGSLCLYAARNWTHNDSSGAPIFWVRWPFVGITASEPLRLYK